MQLINIGRTHIIHKQSLKVSRNNLFLCAMIRGHILDLKLYIYICFPSHAEYLGHMLFMLWKCATTLRLNSLRLCSPITVLGGRVFHSSFERRWWDGEPVDVALRGRPGQVGAWARSFDGEAGSGLTQHHLYF